MSYVAIALLKTSYAHFAQLARSHETAPNHRHISHSFALLGHIRKERDKNL